MAVLCNAIRPWPILADLAAAVALDTMRASSEIVGRITLVAGTPIEMGEANAVFCNDDGQSLRVITTDPAIGERGELGAAIYLSSAGYRAGKLIGHTTFEPITTIEKGRLTSFSGKDTLEMTYK